MRRLRLRCEAADRFRAGVVIGPPINMKGGG
jgi:hypothetical protein